MTALKLVAGAAPTPTPHGVNDSDLANWSKSKSPTVRRLVAEVERLASALEPVTVCAACYRASCWDDLDRCPSYQFNGSIDLPMSALEAMGLESSERWTG